MLTRSREKTNEMESPTPGTAHKLCSYACAAAGGGGGGNEELREEGKEKRMRAERDGGKQRQKKRNWSAEKDRSQDDEEIK